MSKTPTPNPVLPCLVAGHPIHSALSANVAQYSLTVPNDALRYHFVVSPEKGTASWGWNKTSGHTVTLYDFAHTMDSEKFATSGVSARRKMIEAYADAMLVHEVKGHGALSTRDLPSMGEWCNKNRIHPELLNIMEDARIEAALSAKRPSDTKSLGRWINHLGATVTIPTKSHGGDYGWRKAYWHRYNLMPSCTDSPEHLLSAFVWAEKIRGLEAVIIAQWKDMYMRPSGASHTPDPAIWGKRSPKHLFNFVYSMFMQCRKWKKYTTTESLIPLMMRWKKYFPTPPEGTAHPGGKDVIINILTGGTGLKCPHGHDINPEDVGAIPVNPMPTGEGEGGEEPEKPEERPAGKGDPKEREEPSEEPSEHEAPEAEPIKEHEAPEDNGKEAGETSHDAQDVDLGDGASHELTHETHVVDAPIAVELPAWVNDFAKRDSEFGSSNEKLPADFF